MTRLLLLLIGSLFAQTRSTGPQVVLLPKDDGVVIATKDGYKAAFPSAGFMYFKGGVQSQILTSYCSFNHQVSEVLHKQTDGLYKFRIYPNPASVAVFKNGLRLIPEKHYKLVWTIPNELPTSVDIFDSTESDDIIVDYFIGSSKTIP